eukprot:TRINITY_DN11727_c0_g1_i1.p1 TRINITY_DN11727_c0_g1~~TRINITY_DN11727_c0_g1_i1.p1  ORF type:complete len:293 (+),score=98.37 TRINITY_DN11727_c0_g1_i1:38-880(+)
MSDLDRPVKKQKTTIQKASTKFTLSDLQLSPSDHLVDIGRVDCPQCKQKRKYYCYDCLLIMDQAQPIPNIKLPFKLHVIHHPSEAPAKSTAFHARILSPDDTEIYEFPEFPEQDYDPAVDFLLFPNDAAWSVGEMVEKLSQNSNPSHNSSESSNVQPRAIRTIIVVDSQWQKTKKMLKHPKLKALQPVAIQQYETAFWRYQKVGPHCLATIEAIYYFYREYEEAVSKAPSTKYDDMLFFFCLIYGRIQEQYNTTKKRFGHIEGYIKPLDNVTTDTNGESS